MGVGVQVGSQVEAVGTASFLNAFFSTVAGVLEAGERGARFPALATFYGGDLPATAAPAALTELRTVREELAMHPPGDVVWDLDDPAARPPWGDDISPAITSLADYFVTADAGRDLGEVLLEAFGEGARRDLPVRIVPV